MSAEHTERVRAHPMTVNGSDLHGSGEFDIINPATGSSLGVAPGLRPEALDEVFAAADRAFCAWRTDESLRRACLANAADVLEAAASNLAPILTAEQGKPLREARDEITWAAAWLRYYVSLETPPEVIRDDAGGFEQVSRRPLGVVAAITPWNFPISLAFWKIAPALRAGNTIVVKPSPYTPLTTLAIGHLLRGVFPDGVLNVITGVEPLGAAMVAHPTPRKISFTGSTSVGKRVAVAAASDLKRVTLELGGNDPAIVLADADIPAVARRLFWASFRNNGQACFAVKRILAHDRIHAELVEAMTAIAESAKVGDGMTEGVRLGPINNLPQLRHVEDLVDGAVDRGARVATGGSPLDRPGYFYAPTILDNVTDDMRVVAEEQFGPVVPILSFDDESDAIARANHSEYGLTASVWSSDLDRAASIAQALECGQVSLNNHGTGAQPHLPFGGHKWSGVGVENGPWGLHGFTELQVLTGPPRQRLAPEGTS